MRPSNAETAKSLDETIGGIKKLWTRRSAARRKDKKEKEGEE
jgi:hypothetical protein